MLANGDGIPVKKSLAARYYKLAVDQHYTVAQTELDRMIQTGLPTHVISTDGTRDKKR
jgi:TPR repeat protein